MYTVLKNQKFEFILLIYFLQQFKAVFQNPHSFIPVRLYMTYEKSDNLPLTADKILVRSTDKGSVLQSN